MKSPGDRSGNSPVEMPSIVPGSSVHSGDGDTSSVNSMSVASHHERAQGGANTPITKRYDFGPGIAYDDHEDLDDIDAHNNANINGDDGLDFDDETDDEFDSLPLRTVSMTNSASSAMKKCLTRFAPKRVSEFVLRNSMLVTIVVLLILALCAVGVVAHQLNKQSKNKNEKLTRGEEPGKLKDDPWIEDKKKPTPSGAPSTSPSAPSPMDAFYNIHDPKAQSAHEVLQRVVGERHARYFRLNIKKDPTNEDDDDSDSSNSKRSATSQASSKKNSNNVFAHVFDAQHGAFDDAGVREHHPRYAKLTDTFTVETIKDGIGSDVEVFVIVNGTSNVAVSAGAYWYLKYVAGCQVTWGERGTGNQFATLPDEYQNLPMIEAHHVRVGIPRDEPQFAEQQKTKDDDTKCDDMAPATAVFRATAPVRYGWNMCTFSYSAVWWDTARWRREIDWMALHGVNMPLALNAQEYVWYKVFTTHYNISLTELQTWFSGPAFLAWQRAGNVRGFGGPLPLHFLEDQRDLQTFILKAMRALDMKPILPCFGGHIPAAFAKHYPHASISQSEGWNHFPPDLTEVYYLDPTDEHYFDLGRHYVDVQTELFGTDHFYSCDTFNEVDPPSNDADYLGAAAKAVHDGITASDSQGVWVMQAWLFHFGFWQAPQVEAYIGGIKNPDDLLILDLNSEEGTLARKFGDFHGKPWVWNLLHNYGGVRGMYGGLADLASGPFPELYQHDGNWGKPSQRSNMVGIGFTPEAIEQNPVMYELLTDSFWYPHRGAVTSCYNKSASGDDDTDDDEDSSSTVTPVSVSDARKSSCFDAAGDEKKVSIDSNAWLGKYIEQRYGAVPVPARNKKDTDTPSMGRAREKNFHWAWESLVSAVYNQHGHPRTEMEHRPSYPKSDYGWTSNGNPTPMVEAFRRYVTVLEELQVDIDLVDADSSSVDGNMERALAARKSLGLGTVSYDLVDIGKQATTYFFAAAHYVFVQELQLYFSGEYSDKLKRNTHASDRQRAAKKSIRNFIKLLSDLFLKLDELFDQDPNFQMSTRWIKPAIAAANASDPEEVKLFIYNAKNQITQWGPKSQINDYAAKPWSGLYKEYYLGRWQVLFDNVEWVVGNITAKEDAKGMSGHGDRGKKFETTWNSWGVDSQIQEFEIRWNKDNDHYLTDLDDDSVKSSLNKVEKELNDIEKEFGSEKMEKFGKRARQEVVDEARKEEKEFQGEEETDSTTPAPKDSLSNHVPKNMPTFGPAKELLELIATPLPEFHQKFIKMSGKTLTTSSWSGASRVYVRMGDWQSLARLCDTSEACVGFTNSNLLLQGTQVTLQDTQQFGQNQEVFMHRDHCTMFVVGCEAYIKKHDEDEAAKKNDDGSGSGSGDGSDDGSNTSHGDNGGPKTPSPPGDNVIPVNGKDWNSPSTPSPN